MKTFEELELIAPVQRALVDQKYQTPTPIQAKTLPAALAGRDVLGCAQTGTGKTAAFALPILDRFGRQDRAAVPNRPLALVLAPTRELALQIGESFSTYGRNLRLRQAVVYGGVSQIRQVRALNQGVHVVVATPGRLLDLMQQGFIRLEQLETFVLDEVDRMLDMGFLPDLKRIIDLLPDQRQSLFFSATLPPKITELSKRLLRNPVSVSVAPRKSSVETIEQLVMFVERSGKPSLLHSVLMAAGVDRALVFTRTKRGADALAKKLLRSGITSTAIHGNKSQSARQKALMEFRRNRVRVLVATDVAARGIDIDGITHVVNYDLPDEPESYVHRIGRTGRAGAAGTAVSFCTSSERGDLRAIEQLIGMKVPTGRDQPQSETPPAEAAQPKSAPPVSSDHKPTRKWRGQRPAAKKRSASPATRPASGTSPQEHGRKPKRKLRKSKQRFARNA